MRDLAAERHGIVTSADLVEAGVPARTRANWVVQGRLVRLAPGTYLLPDLFDDLSHLHAVQAAYPLAVGSHRSAAWLERLDGIDVVALDVSLPYGADPCLGRAFRTRDLAPFEVVEINGLRVTDPTRTLCDLGAVVSLDVLERAMESALRRRLTSVPRLEWRLAALSRPGRAGPSALRAVLARRPAGTAATESDLETRYLQCLRDHGVPQPVRQFRVWQDGRVIARLDDAYPDKKVFVELDGWEVHKSRDAFQRDRRRQNAVVIALGWLPLRFSYDDVIGEPERVAAETAALVS